MANLNLSEFTEKLFVADADHTFVWDTENAISKRVSRNSWLNSGTLTSDAPVTISQTWNNAAVAFTGLKVNAAGTSGTNSASGSLLLDLQVGGVSSFRVQKDGHLYISNSPSRFDIFVNNTNALSIFSSQVRCLMPLTFSNDGAFNDTFLLRDGAPNTLALRNSTAAQTFRVYNTFLGTTANEWGGFDWLTSANVLRIGTNHGGTGIARSIDFVTGGVRRGGIAGNNGYFDIPSIATGFVSWVGGSGGAKIYKGATDGTFGFYNGSESVSMLLNIATAGYMKVRNIGDTAFNNIQGKLTTDTAYTGTVVAATGYITIYDSTGTAYRVPCAV